MYRGLSWIVDNDPIRSWIDRASRNRRYRNDSRSLSTIEQKTKRMLYSPSLEGVARPSLFDRGSLADSLSFSSPAGSSSACERIESTKFNVSIDGEWSRSVFPNPRAVTHLCLSRLSSVSGKHLIVLQFSTHPRRYCELSWRIFTSSM